MPKLELTGHPLVDVGFVTIAVHANRAGLEDVTEEDLERVAAYLEREFVTDPLRAFLTVAFTSNAWFIQHAYNPDRTDLSAERRKEVRATRQKWADAHLRQWQLEGDPAQRCVFTGLPAVAEVLSNKLTPGRAARAQIPLIQGDDNINFFANGSAGLPVSGLALFALQAFPLGSAKAGNGLLVVHSPNPELTFAFVREFHKRIVQNIALAQTSGATKLPGEQRSPRTLLIETLLQIETERQAMYDDELASVTAYNLNNGKTPDLQLYELPNEIVGFIAEASQRYERVWRQLVQRAWEHDSQESARRNYFYEDLFTLPGNAARFIRTYFLRTPRLTTQADDPRSRYSLYDERALLDFRIVELFLRRVLLMDDVRIERIRTLADKVARYVEEENNKKFFRLFANPRNYYQFRQVLIKANEDYVRAGKEPIFTLQEYVDVFERRYTDQRLDWALARDLVLIRMIEQLKGWLNRNPDAIPDRDIKEDDEESEVHLATEGE